uniref:Uncharacterized protein n=1 Tax=Pyrodinium bahamense TaxID=73915 RepID=A0A7S0FP56_9DINO|mmetsp:Transcript_40165/g.111635  ORF Transcript_40165/g.111635 Transcript_40165/m.111635 type:complete len:100 (+) Transcript_40165:2-301(+)
MPCLQAQKSTRASGRAALRASRPALVIAVLPCRPKNLIGDTGAEALAQRLSTLPAYEFVDLTGNAAISAAGRRAVTAILPPDSVTFESEGDSCHAEQGE